MIDDRRPLAEAERLHALFMDLSFSPHTIFEALMDQPSIEPQHIVGDAHDATIDKNRLRIR